MHMTSHQAMTRLLMLDPTWTLEEMWTKGQRTWNAKDSLAMTEEERAAGQCLEQAGLERLPDGHGLWRPQPGASQSVPLRAAEEVCETGSKARAGTAGKGRTWSFAWLR